VEADDQPELHFFAGGIRRDQDAVTAGLTLPLQQQVAQGLSVVKLGVLLAPWHCRPGPGRGARALGLLPAVTVMTTPFRATAP